MSRRFAIFPAVFALLALAVAAKAHDGRELPVSGSPPASDERTWTHASGRHRVSGSFVALRGDQVRVHKHDGEDLDIRLDALSPEDRRWVLDRNDAIVRVNTEPRAILLAQRTTPEKGQEDRRTPEVAASFQPFAARIQFHWDRDFFYVESDGMPDHRMMVGITAWQQQVPLPQAYTGENAWRIPLKPTPAKDPLSTRNRFLRGAIALAPNGVPIFNPLNNRGEDAYAIGELDEFGGHCGRADDYHYHIAPVHLEKVIGPGLPIAYALDGYPILGYAEADGSAAGKLDAFNGHEAGSKGYHYHASKSYPYLNGGFHGEVTERGGQVDPQPRAEPIREAGRPLRGAKITEFRSPKAGSYSLTYELRGRKNVVNYTLAQDGAVTFQFIDDSGKTTTETYHRRPRGREPGNQPDDGRRPPPRDDDRPPPRPDGPQGRRGPDPNDPNRRPWIQVHAPEMDANHDGALTREELLAETDTTFKGYDRDNNGKLSRREYEGPGGVRSAMGGFVKQHAQEIDADSDGVITRDELRATATRMFDRTDANRDGKLDADELKAPPPQGQGGQRPQEKAQRKGQGGGDPDGGRPNARQEDPNQPPPFRNEVPDHPLDVVLGRPTADSITFSIASRDEAEGYVAYARRREPPVKRTKTIKLPAGSPVELLVGSLDRDTEYEYQIHRKPPGASEFVPSETGTFHTQRSAGSPFTFTVQADSHLDLGTEPDCYVRTLKNALADHPDFHVELGDTFMTDKFARYSDAISQYRAQRYYFGQLCHSAPLFFVQGNHDGESGSRLDGSANNMAVWSANTRKQFFPNPYPDAFYSGNVSEEPFVGKLGDYYAWEWGDALFMVLDPFWYTTTRRKQGDDRWGWTLGEVQFRWLKTTLESSKAKFKFVFIHHLVGGATPEARGGSEAAPFFEWGGRDLDGTWAFDKRRPGWDRPIHQLLIDNHVSAIFHGHDHFYARQERDGVVYQLVPQPGNPRYGTPRSAEEYGYRQGELLNGPGHLRVSVSPRQATVEYVLSVLPRDERTDRKNGQILASYSIPAPGPDPSRAK